MLERRRDPDLITVWLWFEFQKELIGEELGSVFRSLPLGSGSGINNPRHERFIGQTRQEVDEFFNRQTAQLELLTMFELLATMEAILRIDFESWVTAKKRDTLSRRFREIRRRREKIRLDEDILAAMKAEGIGVSGFRGLLNLRHWRAHGRHWSPRLGGSFTPYIVFDTSKALVDAIPL